MNLITSHQIDSEVDLTATFMPHQLEWINGEHRIHSAGKQVVALAEKSVRIGWTYADAFKNVRKRLHHAKRDYLFATKDYPSALEYIRTCKEITDLFNLSRTIVSAGEENFRLPKTDARGRVSSLTEDVKVGVIKFDNGSRIIAFSANPQAMAVYGGDVGLDEFAKHQNARLLWETAQGRITWGYDIAIWSSHDGEDTLFNEFAQEARAILGEPGHQIIQPSFSYLGNESIESIRSSRGNEAQDNRPVDPASANSNLDKTNSDSNKTFRSSIFDFRFFKSRPKPAPQPRNNVPWNLYFKVTIEDAVRCGLVDVINKSRGTDFTPEQFLVDCRARARDEEIFQQSYMCNPIGATANHIVDWSAIERCRWDHKIDRVHLEAEDIQKKFGSFKPGTADQREQKIHAFLEESFPSSIFNFPSRSSSSPSANLRLGFDVAASGTGDLAAIYIDEKRDDIYWLRALFTCRTEDWHFLKTVLFHIMDSNQNIYAAGDETGLGRQICWEAAQKFGHRWKSINFASEKHDLGFTLMNQMSVAQKRFPRSHHDIASDYFALRKIFNGNKWNFTEGKNSLNPASHCDIAWAGALASAAPDSGGPSASVVYFDDETADQRLWQKSSFARFIETGNMPDNSYYSRPSGVIYGPK
jgi:phage FluMu gp28-like protein